MNEKIKDHYRAILGMLDDEISALVAEKERIATILGEGNATLPALAGSGAGTSIPRSQVVESDTFLGLTIIEAAKKFLKMMGQKQTVAAIALALARGGVETDSDNFATTVSSALARETKRIDEIVKIARGEFGLYEWYDAALKQRHLAEAKRAKSSDEMQQEAMEEQNEVALESIDAAIAAENIKANAKSPTDDLPF